jgi:hypothetical protein
MAQPKPGKTTSEMWVTAIAGILVVGLDVFGVELQSDTINAIAGLVVAYTVGRSAVKWTNKD